MEPLERYKVYVHKTSYVDGIKDGVAWEFSISWLDLKGLNNPRKPWTPNDELTTRIDIFDDAFTAFEEVRELFEWFVRMGEDTNYEDTVFMLDELGFIDITEEENGDYV